MQNILNRTYSPTLEGFFINITIAGSNFGGNSDSFISWFVPYNDFVAATVLNNFSAIRVFFGSSSNTQSLTETGAVLVGGTNLALFSMSSDRSSPMATILTNGSSYSHTPYGAVIDRNGIIWSAHLSSHMLKINLSSDPVNITKISITNTYGLGLDFQDHLFVGGSNQLTKVDINDVPNPVLWTKPAKVIQGVTTTSDNNIWVAGNSLNSVSRYGLSTPSGVAVDAAGKVWETVAYDGGSTGTIWGRVSWNSFVPAGGSIEVSVRTAETEAGLQVSASLPVNNANDFSAIGRFIQIETILKANSAKESPVLYDLSIDQAGTRIMGKVFENGTEIGIPGVNVSTNTSISNVTNETGYYLLDVPEGSYILTARLEPVYYMNNTIIVNTAPKADVMQDIEIAKRSTGNITGSVTV